jgi:DNA invertase Pin-like site-specific DNA recombinase
MPILRAGCYERVSTDEQAKYGFSIKTQIEALNEHCEKNQIKVVDHYTDDGVSGGKPAFRRPQMSRLLDDVKAGRIDIILFTRLDRWFRNVPEYFKVQELLDKYGVQWRAIWEDYDTTTSNGRMAITIFLAIAQAEREKGSERIKVVFDNKVKNGETFFQWKCMPFGYTREIDENGAARLVKDPDLKEALETFWDMVIKYQNVAKAGKYVNMAYGLHRSIKAWGDVSKNEIHTGRYRGIDNYCEPYVKYEDWLKLQGRRIKKAQGDRVYLFTGIIPCPDCGRILTSKFTTNKRASGEKIEYRSYHCKRHSDHLGCKFARYVGEPIIERYLLANLDRLLADEVARVTLEKTKPKKKPKLNVASLREQLRRLNVAYRAGNMSDDEYLEESKEINQMIVKAEAEAKEDPAEKDVSALKVVMETDFRSIYEELSPEDRRRFWRSIIEEIYLDMDGNVISVDFLYPV